MAFVRNILNIKDSDNNTVPTFINVDTLEEYNFYSFIQDLQMIKTEDPFNYNLGYDIEDIKNNNTNSINNNIVSLILNYTPLIGDISHEILTPKGNELYISISIILLPNVYEAILGNKYIDSKSNINIGMYSGRNVIEKLKIKLR